MTTYADIAIIGAGLMGCSTALCLARKGKKVILLEKESFPRHASAVNAGGVRQLNRSVEEIPISVGAMELWPRLDKIVGNDCGFRPVGQILIAPHTSAMNALEQRIESLTSLGFYHEELISPFDVKRLVPAYSGKCSGGIMSKKDGFALPALTLKTFKNAACSAGVQFQSNCKVIDIAHNGSKFKFHSEDGRTFESGVLVNCAGAWGKTIAAFFDDQLPIEPTGLSMMVTARMPRFITPVIGIYGEKLSFKQMENNTVLIGGGRKAVLNMVNERTDLDFSEMQKSAQTVQANFPIMKKASVVRCWAGIEGIIKDHLPVISKSNKIQGLFHVCGFSTHGFQLSPMIGRLAASMVMDKSPEVSLEAFSMNRFETA